MCQSEFKCNDENYTEVLMQGSVAYKLASKNSDLDITIPLLDSNGEPMVYDFDNIETYKRLTCFKDYLNEKLLSMNVNLDETKVSIVSSANPTMKIAIKNDLEIDVSCHPIQKVRAMNELILKYLNFYNNEMIRKFISIVKLWSKNKGINGGTNNYPSSITWVFLCIKSLQHFNNILPVLKFNQNLTKLKQIKSAKIDYNKKITMRELLSHFFGYLLTVDWTTEQISITRTNRREKKGSNGYTIDESNLYQSVMVVQDPFDSDVNLARHVKQEQLNYVRKCIIKARANIRDFKFTEFIKIENGDQNKNNRQNIGVKPIQDTYKTGEDYKNIYCQLIDLECQYQKKLLEQQTLENVNLKWNTKSPKPKIHFKMKEEDYNAKMSLGTVVDIILKNFDSQTWCQRAVITEINYITEIVTVEFKDKIDVKLSPKNINEGYKVEFVWLDVPFRRMKEAITTLCKPQNENSLVYNLVMGNRLNLKPLLNMSKRRKNHKKWNVPGLPELNHSQITAIKHCVSNPLSMIQGPPGTGKTVTSASVVYHLRRVFKDKVLVVAPSNIAVDHLALKIHKTGLNVVRVASLARELVPSEAKFLYLRIVVIRQAKEQNNKLWKLHEKLNKTGILEKEEAIEYNKLIQISEMKLVESADVICCTCVGAGSSVLERFIFKRVLIDEATQANEPETLISIVKGAEQIILVGDHKQLGSIVLCKRAENAGLQRSLFERLINTKRIESIMLKTQYRMHPCLAKFSNNQFYNGIIQNGITSDDRINPKLNHFWPNKETPTFFYCNFTHEARSKNRVSYLNNDEAYIVMEIVNYLINSKKRINAKQIGIITPYEGQRRCIANCLSKQIMEEELNIDLYKDLEIANVDAFQGREKDYIILSCVRSNKKNSIGFLKDPKRLNVALTRAKYGLIIIGNPSVLSANKLWHKLLKYYQNCHLLVNGNIRRLQKYYLNLTMPTN